MVPDWQLDEDADRLAEQLQAHLHDALDVVAPLKASRSKPPVVGGSSP